MKKNNIENVWGSPKQIIRRALISIFIGVVVGLALLYLQEKRITEIWGVVIKSLFSGAITFIFITIPSYLIDTQKRLLEDVINAISKIDECPRMMALHTEDNLLESKIKSVDELQKNNERWIMSKYISKLLSVSIKSFTIDFKLINDDEATREYSKFSSEIINECKESVKLTGSMTPYEWLFDLAKDKDNKNNFFNNTIAKEEFLINDNNHSKILKNKPIDKKIRIVCLSEFNYSNLFVFENSIKAYYHINEGIKTKFIPWDENREKHMHPLEYEYALYDDSLLFKFNKETKVLEVQKGGDEFDELIKFFEEYKSDKIDNKREKDKLIKESHEKKQRLLKTIIKRNQIPHKYSYLFNDEWEKFLERSDRYCENAKNTIGDAISYFWNNETALSIIEIGAGNGDKIDEVCDHIGTRNIKDYELVDISSRLLRKAKTVLLRRFKNDNDRVCDTVLDICDCDSRPDVFKGKSVLLLNNSTIFPENNFPWKKLQKADRILITLDLFEENTQDLFDEYYKARELFLSPLKIFEVPIISELITEDDFKFLFSDNSDDNNYSDDNPIYHIYFNLNAYLDIVSFKESQKRAKDIADRLSSDENKKLEIVNCIKNYRNNHEPLKWKIEEDKGYINKCDELYKLDKLIILSSLKFKKDSTSGDNINKEKIKSYFENKLDNQFEIDAKYFGSNSKSSYVGISMKKRKD